MQDRWITDWPPSERWPHYTRSNAGEVLPTPASPLGQQAVWDRAIVPGWRDGYVRQGTYSIEEWDSELPEACGFFGGFMYINLSNVRMQGVRSPAVTVEQLDLAFFGDHPDVPPYSPHPDDERPDLVRARCTRPDRYRRRREHRRPVSADHGCGGYVCAVDG